MTIFIILKFSLIGRATSYVGGQTPVLIGITDQNPQVSLALAQYAESHQAAGLVLIPFFEGAGPKQADEITRNIINFTSNVPVIFYNNSDLQNGQPMPVEWAKKWSDHPRVTGIKHSVRLNPDNPQSVTYFKQMAALQTEKFHVAVGDAPSIVPAINLALSGSVSDYLVPGCVPIQASLPELTPAFAGLFRPEVDLTKLSSAVSEAINQYPSILSVVAELAKRGTVNADTAEIYHALWKK